MKYCGIVGKTVRRTGLALSALALSCLAFAPCTAAAADAAVPSEKDETVYVYTNPDGSVKRTEVSTFLKNSSGSPELSDSSNLTGIEGEDDKTFAGSGDSIVWNAGGDNVTYKGATTAALPVSIRVTYTLDGQPIAAEDLAGKSGKVTIRYDYENHSSVTVTVNGASQTVYTPFTCITALMLDGKDFKNITVENGKTINDGDDVIVAGYAMPGLKQSLGYMADDADLPDHFSVTADVTSFELKSTMTIATAGLMSEFDTNDLGVGDFSAAGALTDAMGKLIEGSSKLTDGLVVLKDGIGAVNEGTGALTQGATSLSGGLYQLTYGTGEAPGLQGASEAATQLVSGLDQVSAGLLKLVDETTGLPAAAAALTELATAHADETATIGAAQAELKALLALEGASALPHENIDKVMLDAGTMAATVGQVAPGVKTASDGLKEASSTLASIATGAKSLPQGLATAVEVAKQLYGGASELEAHTAQLEDATKQLAEGAQAAVDGSKTLTQGMQTFNDEGVSQLVNTLQNDFGGTLDRINALSDAAKSYDNFGGITQGTAGSVKFVFETDAIKKQ